MTDTNPERGYEEHRRRNVWWRKRLRRVRDWSNPELRTIKKKLKELQG